LYEGSTYFAGLLFPALGLAGFGAGRAPGYPHWLQFGGILLVAVGIVMGYGVGRMSRRSSLRITATTLGIRQVSPKGVVTEIPREAIQSIAPKTVSVNASVEALQAEIIYSPKEFGNTGARTIDLGLELTVPPTNLVNALIAWKDAAPGENPNALLDRVERLLRGRATAHG